MKPHEIRTVRAFSQHEFANYVAYLRMMNVLHNFPREDLEYFYMMTQAHAAHIGDIGLPQPHRSHLWNACAFGESWSYYWGTQVDHDAQKRRPQV